MTARTRRQNQTRRAQRLAAQRATATRQHRRRVWWLLAVGAGLVAVLAAALWHTAEGPATASTWVRSSGATLTIGPRRAPQRVVVYEDLGCPKCREFEHATHSWIRRAAARGEVSVSYRPFRLLDDPYSERSLAAYLSVLGDAPPREALAFHDRLYADQPAEAATHKPNLDDLEQLAHRAGVNATARREIARPPRELLEQAQQDARSAGVMGTPWVLLNGRLVPGSSVAQIETSLRALVTTR